MSLELIRDAVKLSQLIGEDSTQTVVENDIIVPDIKPDVAQILLLDGNIVVKSTEVIQEKILVNGTILFKILYISDDANRSIKSINTSSSFSYDMDMPNARPGMKCGVKCDIEHIDHSILNGRKINTKTIVKLAGKIKKDLEQEIVNDLRGTDDIQILKGSINVNSYVGENEENYAIKERLEVPAGKPAIAEILRSDIKITSKDYKVTDSKIIAKGALNVSTLYLGSEDQNIQFMEHEIPFTQFLDLPGVDENSICETGYQVVDSQFEPQEDSDGELRYLDSDVVLQISAAGFVKKNMPLLEDAYGTRSRLNIEKEPVKFEETVSENKSQVVVKETVAIPDGGPDIAEVFNVLCNPGLSEYKIVDNKLVIDGIVKYSILYLAGNSELPVFCHEQEAFFKHGMDIKGLRADMNCEIELDVEHCTYSMVSSREVEVRLVINVTSRASNRYSVPLISRVIDYPMEDKRAASQPSITIYFSQPGDTSWKVAKKYSVTVGDIQRINNLAESDVLVPGQQIIIPRKLA